MILRKITPNMNVYAVIATDSVAARGLVNGWCLPRSGRRDILSVAITAFIFIVVILRIIVPETVYFFIFPVEIMATYYAAAY